MLTLAHQPDFKHLNRRVQRTHAFAIARPPTTVAVFDDALASKQFQLAYPDSYAKLVPLNLRSMLGDRMYAVARSVLRDDAPLGKLNPGPPGKYQLSTGCGYRATGGRNYQSLKKFFGALHGPSHCSLYWVSDAETWPFRRYHWDTLVAPTARAPLLPFVLATSWFPNRWGCAHVLDGHRDATCGALVAQHLRTHRYWDMEPSPLGARAHAAAAKTVQRKMLQTKFDLNNWWFYEPRTVRKMIAHTERASNMTFVDFWVAMRLSDSAYWRYWIDHAVTLPDATMQVKSYLDAIQQHFPRAYDHCCACSGAALAPPINRTSKSPPCYFLADLWSPCFMRFTSHAAVAKFIFEQLGIFGIFGNRASKTPVHVLHAEPRISWLVNNADRCNKNAICNASYWLGARGAG